MKRGVGGGLCECPGPPGRRTRGSQSKFCLKHPGGKNDNTAAVLLRAHHEKVGFFGKDSNAGENRRQQGKEKIKYEMDCLHKRGQRHESAVAVEGAVEDRTSWTSLIHRVSRVRANSVTCNTRSIPLYGCATVCLFIHPLRDLGFFQFLIIMSSAALMIC